MCGIAGFFVGQAETGTMDLRAVAVAMADAIVHRGPNEGDTWQDPFRGVALAHRRLSILDLSPAGHQPMVSACGRYVLVFNGEIYNHLDLRQELEKAGYAPAWHGHSDTETLLAGFAAWGLTETLKRSMGMFALALWDRKEALLSLARDRMGEKPLYYGRQGASFLFASELKALRAHPHFHKEVDRQALALYLRHNYIPAPRSIYRGISKLPPGCWLEIAPAEDAEPRIRPYWSVAEVAEVGQARPFVGTDDEAMAELEMLLSDAVGKQMLADVPLGAFLSGGVDSSTVVALMQARSIRPVKTFTIGFDVPGYNEAEHAKSVAAYLGTEHTELYVTAEEAMGVIPQLSRLYDEPFADSSQIPTFLVAQLARQHVTVALSGDGGDELFGGYNRYFWAQSIWQRIGWVPRPLRATLAGLTLAIPPSAWNGVFAVLTHFIPTGWRYANPGDKLHKLAEILGERSAEDVYLSLVSFWKNSGHLLPGTNEPPTILTDRARWPSLPDFEQLMMCLDQMTYLPDDILTKVDRATMGVSLETRAPLLDHRVVEFAWSLPLSLKIRDGQGKWPLRQILYKHVPQQLIERPKAGFAVPLDTWLRGPLKFWGEDLLNENRLRREGWFDPAPIREKWREHLSGKRNWSYYLWGVLMFQAWLERW